MRRASTEPPLLKGFSYVDRLGAGGFSDVFLYDQELPKRRVAVKVLLTEGLTPETRAAFVAEANLMAQLSAHPYIVSIYHADVADDGRPYFIMEYCPGQNLSERLKQEPFAVAEALRTGIRISSAVATAHSAGILHRDIKPANVLTNNYGWPALTDFGISSAVEDELPIHTTTRTTTGGTGSTTGTQSVGLSVPWSPPEMFEDNPKPDVRSDIFSLAATIYTLLAGRTPFEVPGRSNQSLELMSRIERGAITPLERTDVPPELLAVLRKGMSVERSQRYATAVDFARALQSVELALSYSPTPIDVPNLEAIRPERGPAGNQEDETRARGVTSIAAQPLVVAPPPSAEAEATRLRGVQHVAATPPRTAAPEATVLRAPVAAVVEPTTPDAKPASTGRRRGAVLGVVFAVLAVVAVVVSLVVFLPRDGEGVTPPDSSGNDDPIDVGGIIPTPELGEVILTPDGTQVTFTWSNPEPQDGDAFLWQRTDGAGSDETVPTDEAVAVVSDVAPGTNVCIEVSVNRAGALSPNPLKVCSA